MHAFIAAAAPLRHGLLFLQLAAAHAQRVGRCLARLRHLPGFLLAHTCLVIGAHPAAVLYEALYEKLLYLLYEAPYISLSM